MSMRKMLWAQSGACSKNSISASQARLKENLVNVWVLHTLTLFLLLSIMDSWLNTYSNHYRATCNLAHESICSMCSKMADDIISPNNISSIICKHIRFARFHRKEKVIGKLCNQELTNGSGTINIQRTI